MDQNETYEQNYTKPHTQYKTGVVFPGISSSRDFNFLWMGVYLEGGYFLHICSSFVKLWNDVSILATWVLESCVCCVSHHLGDDTLFDSWPFFCLYHKSEAPGKCMKMQTSASHPQSF